MADVFSPEKRSFVMSRILGKGNERTEKRLIEIMRKHLVTGWRRHQDVLGRPDFVFRKAKVAVFVDGCYWHCCPKHGRVPKSNISYWVPKLARNKERDREVTRELRAVGWKVVRFWQHELADSESRVAKRLQTALSASGHAQPARGAGDMLQVGCKPNFVHL